MKLKKWLLFPLLCHLMFLSLCISPMATNNPSFRYEITVDGKDTVEVDPGDIITVTLHLYRTDVDEAYIMYAMQDEIRYDSKFLELVSDSALPSNGIGTTDIGIGDGLREFYMNYVSMSGGTQWQSQTRIGSFQLKVTGESGVTTLSNEDFLVSLPDGSGSYSCEANTLTIVLSTDCTVRFETNGGTPIESITAIYGELLSCPENPVREGKHLVGWFKDLHLTEEWNFETDTVNGNMTLYAKWADGEPEPEEPLRETDCIICNYRPALVLGLCWLSLLFIVLIALDLFIAIYLIYQKSKKQNIYKRNYRQ